MFLAGTTLSCCSSAFADLSADILRAGKAIRFRARGASMEPLVRDGDVVLVRPVSPHSVRVGDVVLFRHPAGHVVVHRVIHKSAGRDGHRFVVQGDRASRPDGVIDEGQLLGRVAVIDRQGVQMKTNRLAMRLLGRFVVLRARWDLGRHGPYRWARLVAGKLPGLSRYLR